jgi:hypothetical protein
MIEIVCIRIYLVASNAAWPSLWHTAAMSAPDPKKKAEIDDSSEDPRADDTSSDVSDRPKEIGGRGGLDPTRYGDWEKAGRCIDF